MFEAKPTTEAIAFPSESCRDMLTPILREGAQKMLTKAIEEEVQAWIDERAALRDTAGRRLVVRNGHQPARSIQTGVGDVELVRPRVHDRRTGADREVFHSKILPPYLRRAKSIEELIPWLYLKGISTGGFSDALQSLLGADAAGLSPSTITRLIHSWHDEHATWSTRSLEGKHYVYVWADGIYFNVRLGDAENSKQCILVLLGATATARRN